MKFSLLIDQEKWFQCSQEGKVNMLVVIFLPADLLLTLTMISRQMDDVVLTVTKAVSNYEAKLRLRLEPATSLLVYTLHPIRNTPRQALNEINHLRRRNQRSACERKHRAYYVNICVSALPLL